MENTQTTLIPPLTFRMYQTIRFSRPVDASKDHVSPGGYELEMMDEKGKTTSVQFDFEDYEGTVDDKDPCVMHVMQKNPDMDAYEDLRTVTEYMLQNVVTVAEWFIYTGEPGEQDLLEPVEVTGVYFEIISDAKGKDAGCRRITLDLPIHPVSN